MSEALQLCGTLIGHNGWVIQIDTNPKDPDTISEASRDCAVIVWKLTGDEDTNYGYSQKRLCRHSPFISDALLSSDGNYLLSASRDQTLRLWNLAGGKTKDVLWVAVWADTVKLSPVLGTGPSSCGTHWLSANTFRRLVTPLERPVCVSRLTTP